MKYSKLILFAILFRSMSVAQPNTGATIYTHTPVFPDPVLSSGTHVLTDPGFIMAGYRTAIPGGPNLIIDKVDVDGLFNASLGEFAKQYTINTGGLTCSVNQSQVTNCSGVSIIETFQSSYQYAIAAAFDEGIIVAFLDNSGAVTPSQFYPFPVATSFYSKPLIAESSSNPGNYFIVGNYQDAGATRDYIYVIKTDLNFTTGWGALYDLGAGTSFKPYGIVESSFVVGTGELIVVGHLDLNTGSSLDGFMMALDDFASGSINFADRHYSNGAVNDWFSSVQLANSNSGYIAGGFTNTSPTLGTAWMKRVTSAGANSWTSRIEFTNDNLAGDIVSVQERLNSVSAYEYYGLSTSAVGGMLVCKLNNSGAAFGGANNEFWYQLGGTGQQPVSSSFNNNPGNPNEGLHFFGNSNNATNGFHLIQSCFNGAAGSGGAQNLTTLSAIHNGPGNKAGINVSKSGGLSPCSYYGIFGATATHSPLQIGYVTGAWPTTPYAGNNNKTVSITGIEKKEAISKTNIYPNPVVDILNINMRGITQDDISVEIQNMLGQTFYKEIHQTQGNSSFELKLSLKDLHLKQGLYLVRISNGVDQQVRKIVFNRE